MNNFMEDTFFQIMAIPFNIAFFAIILDLIRFLVSKKKHGSENKTFKKITEILMGISMMMILFTCAALYVDMYTMFLVGIRSFSFWIKFDWPIELLFLCSVIYVIYLVWKPQATKNNNQKGKIIND